VKLAYALEH